MPRKKKASPTLLEQARKEAAKQFRRNLAILKRKGLVSKKYDARKQTETKYLKSVIKKFQSVISGNAGVATTKKKKAQQFKKAGYTTSGTKVVIPKQQGEKVRITPKGNISVKRPMKGGGTYEVVHIPVPYHNLEQYLHDISNPEYEGLKNKGDKWAFQFYGYNSRGTFQDLELLVYALHMYRSGEIHEALSEHNPNVEEQVYQNLAIVRVKQGAKWKASPSRGMSEDARARLKMRKAERHANMTESEYIDYLDRERAKSKEKRARIANNPEALDSYRAKARERAAKSKANLKALHAKFKK